MLRDFRHKILVPNMFLFQELTKNHASKKLHFIVEGFDLNAPQIADKISELYSFYKNSESPDVVAIKINSILLHGEQIPLSLLNAAWDLFAKKNGVKNE